MAKAPSPERLKLATAIAHRRDVVARQAALAKAQADAGQRFYELNEQIAQAEAALANAPEVALEFAIAVAQGTAGPAPLSLREAKERLAALQLEADENYSTREALRQRAYEEERLDSSTRQVREAAVAVMKVELAATKGQLIAEANRLRGELIATLGELSWFGRAGLLDKAEYRPMEVGLAEFSGDPSPAAEAKWKPVLERLMVDADAQLN